MADSESHVFHHFHHVARAAHKATFDEWRWVAGTVVLLACAARCSAASSGSSPAPSGGGTTDSGASGDAGAPADSGSQADWSVQRFDSAPAPDTGGGQLDVGAGDAGVDPDLQCYGQASAACYQCCVNDHPSGSMVYDNVFYDCMCAAPNGTQAVCQMQCAQTDCSSAADAGGAVTGDPCDLCETAAIGDGGACAAPLNTACGASADCLAFSNCQSQCP
jgi:hypothetical protein